MTELRPHDLIAAAREMTGLTDLGSDSYRDGLDAYCDSVNRESQLSELGVMAVQGTVTNALVNRLRVTDYRARHPEVAEECIERPVFVIGLFRAGTTLLSYLLDQDPANRSLLRWEAGDSVPPPSAGQHRTDPRVEVARTGAAMLDQLNPGFKAIHNEEVDGPTECIAVMAQDFKSLSWESITNVPSYSRWLMECDQTSAYHYHRQVLQVLQSGGVRGRWMLKSPHHALALRELTTVYPDARLVMLHRDPVVLSASAASLIGSLSGTFSDANAGPYIATHWPEMLTECIDRVDAFRAAHPEFPIIDVHYSDLVDDPVATVASLYAALSEEFTATARAAVADYVVEHPKGKFGAHRYDLASLGLDGDRLVRRFATYVDRYGVTTEHPR
jgi:hypothetical protein